MTILILRTEGIKTQWFFFLHQWSPAEGREQSTAQPRCPQLLPAPSSAGSSMLLLLPEQLLLPTAASLPISWRTYVKKKKSKKKSSRKHVNVYRQEILTISFQPVGWRFSIPCQKGISCWNYHDFRFLGDNFLSHVVFLFWQNLRLFWCSCLGFQMSDSSGSYALPSSQAFRKLGCLCTMSTPFGFAWSPTVMVGWGTQWVDSEWTERCVIIAPNDILWEFRCLTGQDSAWWHFMGIYSPQKKHFFSPQIAFEVLE